MRSLDLRPRLDVSPAAVVVLLVCLGAAGLAWREVARAGYFLEPAELLGLAGLCARLVVLPGVLLVVSVRRGWWGGIPRSHGAELAAALARDEVNPAPGSTRDGRPGAEARPRP